MTEENILLFIQRSLHNDVLIVLMTVFSMMGNYGAVRIFISVFAALRKRDP